MGKNIGVKSWNISFFKLVDSKKNHAELKEGAETFVSVVCRVKRKTCRLKSDCGNLVVHPYSLREVLRVTWSTKFPDKGSERELSKPAGRSASELGCSLDKTEWSCRPFHRQGKAEASILTITAITDRWTSGVSGVTRRGSHTTMNTGDPYRCPLGQPADIRKRRSIGLVRESELPILYRLHLKDNITLREGRGNASVAFPKVRRKGIAEML